jgi:hypothetical protein
MSESSGLLLVGAVAAVHTIVPDHWVPGKTIVYAFPAS